MADETNSTEDQPTLPPVPPEGLSAADQPTVVPQTSAAPTRSSAVPQLDGYEIQDELGRGGMGVVYKARDTNLDRTVALKMVLGGKFASPEEIQRFRIEGEAAARLDHPGIVPIYEIGEADGNHFFSMKFIDGSPLSDRSDEFKSNNRKAVELLIKIARAVQHAHQRGVLHRDLKPANVLIDEHGDPSVTDLGLAKRMDGDSELTQTGLVMGTPGFMAPEQAAGQKDITTAADVFSLGAILYWLMTGEAPFAGETAVQTVMNTIECETPSVRSKVYDADADLDLICQKAMSKDPLKRYSSAAALADDLQAWLDDELLSVRAPTALSLASVWIRKNLRTVLGAFASGIFGGVTVGVVTLFMNLKNAAWRESSTQDLGPDVGTWVGSFTGILDLKGPWDLIQFLIVPAIAVAAFMCVLLVRPKTREASVVASITSGLVAGILVFMISIGWTVVGEHAVEPVEKDLQLLTTAVWLDSGAERKLAQQALIQRYPGLAKMDRERRELVTQQKVEHDVRTAIMPGIWMAVLASLMYTTLPLATTCILSGMSWNAGRRGWHWFGNTWERGAYCLVFFLMASFFLRGLGVSPVVMFCSLAAVLFALVLAVKEVHWIWRVLMIPVPFLGMGWIDADINGMQKASNRAGDATTDAELRQQTPLMDRWLENHERSDLRFKSSIAWLYLGDEERYQFHCRKTLSAFENAYQPGVGSRLAKMCLLRPDLQEESALPLLNELTEFASAFESDPSIRWFYGTRALAELRRGDGLAALQWSAKCRADEGDENAPDTYRFGLSHIIDALAYIEQNEKANATAALERARSATAKVREISMEDGRDNSWVNWLVFQILEREVVSKLN